MSFCTKIYFIILDRKRPGNWLQNCNKVAGAWVDTCGKLSWRGRWFCSIGCQILKGGRVPNRTMVPGIYGPVTRGEIKHVCASQMHPRLRTLNFMQTYWQQEIIRNLVTRVPYAFSNTSMDSESSLGANILTWYT